MKNEKEEIKRIIETNDIEALRSRLKKQGVKVAVFCVLCLFITILGILNPENWQWYHWLFPFFVVVCFVILIFIFISYNKLRHTNDCK